MSPNLEELKKKAEALPGKPGVYMWLDSRGNIIYVGKAKNLRQRVMSYFHEEGDGRLQVPWLMSRAAGLDYIVTDSEIEALVTEANLARARKPKYNVRLKDDKRYPYIKITKEEIPRIYLTRTIRDDGARYIGPYTDVKAVRRTLKLVHSIFPVRLCRRKLPSNTPGRACLNYQIKRCSGPCVGFVTAEEYNRYIEQAYKFIRGHNKELVEDLRKRMREAAEELKFEFAADIRDRIKAIEKVTERSRVFSTARLTGDWDVVNYHVIDNEACMVIMEIREGNILGKKDYLLGGINYASPEEMLATFLVQYYMHASWLPPEIHLPLVPADAGTLSELLSGRRNGPVEFVYPKRGEKARLLKMTATNAELIMVRTIRERDGAKDAVPNVVLALKRDLHLKSPPRTIACIDISHLHGTDTVGSLVFFRDGRPRKKEYRRFRIRSVEGVDDFMCMREVVERYFRRRMEEGKELPDLLLVDGGKGQLSSALSVLRKIGLGSQPVAGLAKRLEEVFLPGAGEAQSIPKTSSSLHLLQRIRDEAHRFALTYQKKLRKRRVVKSALTDIEGVGPVAAQALLGRFGSVEAVGKATLRELMEVPGIGPKTARAVRERLSEEETQE